MDSRASVAAAAFILGYILVSARRVPFLPIGRPAGAMVGAVLMVACGVLTPERAYHHINLDTILLLLGTMLITSHLSEAGFFALAADRVIARAGTARGLLRSLVFFSGILSALLVNDTVCVMFTPLLVAVLRRTGLPAAPYLLALATASNIGSAMTLAGNPQNMIIGTQLEATRARLDYLGFALHLAPAALLGLWLNYRFLLLWFGRQLPEGPLPTTPAEPYTVDRPLLIKSLVALGLVLVGFCVLPTKYLAWTALGGAAVLIVSARRDPHAAFARVDWPLLVFFAGLFVLIGGINEVGLTRRAYEAVQPLFTDDLAGVLNFSWFSLAGSNVFSNVPFVLVVGGWMPELAGNEFARVELMWMVLALTSTLAGNLTLIGSVANIIVMEIARKHYAMGFREYLKFGFPTTLITTAAGLACLLGMNWLMRASGG
jgi:Na+/H+ antiporter NhaD/arsenite permease-like protein